MPRAIKFGIPGGAIFERRGKVTKLIELNYKKIDSDFVLKPPPQGYDYPVSNMDLKPTAKPNKRVNTKEPPTLFNQNAPTPKNPVPPKSDATPHVHMDVKISHTITFS